MPRPLVGCSETLKHFNEALQRFRIYVLNYEALQHFIEALSNLTRPWPYVAFLLARKVVFTSFPVGIMSQWTCKSLQLGKWGKQTTHRVSE